MYKLFLSLILAGLLCSCQRNANNTQTASGPLFSLLGPETTGIQFRNDLPESLYMNGLFYEYYYNGAGLAVGDFNNDELPDIYFVSNLGNNEMYLNRGDLQFELAGEATGVAGRAGFPTGVTTVDINHDGWLDIYVCASGKFRDPDKRRNELFVNQGPGPDGQPQFREMGAEYGLDLEDLSTQAAFFDYDRDGDLDLFLINHDVDIYGDEQLEEYQHTPSVLSGERLYRNDDGRFVNVSAAAGIRDNRLSYGLGLAIGDVNNDGWPDVYVGHDFSGEDHLYINRGDGTFSERIKESMRHISNFSMGNDLADFNNDGWLDIMAVDMVSEDNYGIKTSMSGMNPDKFFHHVDLGLHHQYMFNTLQLNNGASGAEQTPYFSEMAHLAGVSNTDWSWAPLFFDMDLDGDKDLFVGNGIKRDFRNNDFVRYHKALRAELAEKGSIDEEAYIKEVMAKMPERKKVNYFFLNNDDLTFTKISIDTLPGSSNGATYADLDNDGDLDMITNNMDDLAFVYRNNSTEQGRGNYLKIRLEGPAANPLGIGTRVQIVDQLRTQTLEHQLTRGFQSAVAPGLHFGLGPVDRIDLLTVTWPDGKRQELTDLPVNQTLNLRYEDATAEGTKSGPAAPLFDLVSTPGKAPVYQHRENEFDDFARESLLPHRMSRFGPALTVGDINGDGLDDVFVGGAAGFAGKLWLQDPTGAFASVQEELWMGESAFEDVSALFFDADQDQDLDLYVVSGGNEMKEGHPYYLDRFYENVDGSFRRLPTVLRGKPFSGSCVAASDYDGDGDLDLFVGGRQKAGKYPYPVSSRILENRSQSGQIVFEAVAADLAPGLTELGMVTDAEWADLDGDQRDELILAGEWMPLTVLQWTGERFENRTEDLGLSEQTGWWFSVQTADMDGDGDLDILAGNLGLNYKYKASPEEPFEVYANDFDASGSIDIVLGYYNQGGLYPLRGRQCSSNQMPFIKKKFPTYDAFGKAELKEVYEPEKLAESVHYQARNFGTTYFEQTADGTFKPHILPSYAQLSSTNAVLIHDFNRDEHPDLLLAGNLYSSEVETSRNDAGYGVFLAGDGTGKFSAQMPYENGLYLQGDVKAAAKIRLAGGDLGLLFATNNGPLQLVRVREPAL
ncbi:FG-GAP-like repeat-containing protein [Flavilitoribacter nigricans]|nr:FG-GAP-like repeat-containing protein [Flavilitoribacter nigricans]